MVYKARKQKKENMKHVELFENFMPSKTGGKTFLLGYYGEGGIGSHPAVVTESELLRCGFVQQVPAHLISSDNTKIWSHKDNDFFMFIETSKSPMLPEALLCAYNDDYLWDIKGISGSLGKNIVDMIGDDTISSFDDEGNDEMVNQIEKMTGLPQTSDSTIITIIPNPSPNTIYWSDVPEQSHSYWMPPYKAMSLEELVIRN
jgi:hypothetical protein